MSLLYSAICSASTGANISPVMIVPVRLTSAWPIDRQGRTGGKRLRNFRVRMCPNTLKISREQAVASSDLTFREMR